uniref:UBP-type domain-containing protein n=1 Tax=Trypanosoma congolense (strain IL3000) TaxID=1068625 RepID=G0UKV6_TRYCI|nr:conserved hypothetical protein [Trypanosoma congolense IL3000]
MLRYLVTDIAPSGQTCKIANDSSVHVTIGHVKLFRRLTFKREFFVPFVPTKHILLTFQTFHPLDGHMLKGEVIDTVSRYFDWIERRTASSLSIVQLAVCTLSGCTVVVVKCPDVLTALDMHSVSQEGDAPTVGSRRVLAFPCDNEDISDTELESNYYIVPTCTLCAERLEPTLTGYGNHTCSCPDGKECRCLLEQSSCLVCQTCIKMQYDSQRVQCDKCNRAGDPWICLVCGFVGCSRYQARHAKDHYCQEKHLFSMSLLTQQVWDYDSDAFVHRVVVLLDNTTGILNRVQYPDRDSIPTALTDESVEVTKEVKKKHINAKFDSKVEMSNEQLALMIINELHTRRMEYESELQEKSGVHEPSMCAPSLSGVVHLGEEFASLRERWKLLHNTSKSIREELLQRKAEEEALRQTCGQLEDELRGIIAQNATRSYALLKEMENLRETIADVETNLKTFGKLSQKMGNDSAEKICIVGRGKEQKSKGRGNGRSGAGR